MITITRNRFDYTLRNLNWRGDSLLEYAINAYGFLIAVGQTLTLIEFGELIGQHYSLENPRNKIVVDHLQSIKQEST